MSDNPFDRRNHQETLTQPAAPRSSGFSTCGIVAGVIVGFGIILMICCGGAAFFGKSIIDKPIDEAIVALEADAEIAEALGTPIESATSFGTSRYQNDNGNGEAEIQFQAKGPKGKAGVRGEMKLENNVWSVGSLNVTLANGDKIRLPRGQAEDVGQDSDQNGGETTKETSNTERDAAKEPTANEPVVNE